MKTIVLNTGFLLTLALSTAFGHTSMSRGITLFNARQWTESIGSFIDVLQADPANKEAHAYLARASRELEAEKDYRVREDRLALLENAASLTHERPSESDVLQRALFETQDAKERRKVDRWIMQCEDARLQRLAGRWLEAHDLVLQVLQENSGFAEAQRELSLLQSEVRRVLDNGEAVSIMDRYALEGFYAYGQADFAGALQAWGKLRTLAEMNFTGKDREAHVRGLHFGAYEAIARQNVDADTRQRNLQIQFEKGLALFQQKRYGGALEEFRKLAIQDPEYPQLGQYLVQAEAANERERLERIGEAMQRDLEARYRAGLTALEKEDFRTARTQFEGVLKLDPSHARSQTYLAMAHAELKRRHDPKAAQLRYEAGLIAYASGKLDEALSEWRIAARMNPQFEKARVAIGKVEKELAMNRTLEGKREALP